MVTNCSDHSYNRYCLKGPFDVGINLVTNDQITAMMLEMAASEDRLHQSISAELIVQTVSKHERATTMLKVFYQLCQVARFLL